MKTLDVLETVAWGQYHFGSIITNRVLPLRDIRREITNRFVKSIGLVELCDDDGFMVYPTRYKEGYVLTDAGIAYLKKQQSSWAERITKHLSKMIQVP